ncbi:nitrite reductase [NAD(P)H], large subunit [Kwoniella pini CBS 10737]|uniref:Nitrite reductase [NAD(P)H] n=1 Tax=Kwoniella pini CBS 10737 TaxID=1296096 RepID=A0A1B9HT33_9TREE|nr:nitrite reductase [NAD(P)H], large subunit [Kwoniella pini CBS 10737]OCF46433.1 nitrite reductase [NAD(P)H], large subunit [Kwoniella pini CBS 10737]
MAVGHEPSSSGSAHRIQVMVVGLGMVGIAFIEKMLTLDTAGKYFIRTCGEEPVVAYNRVGLTEYFQHRNIEDLYLNDVSWYAEQNPEHFAFHIGEQVLKIDTKEKVVHTSRENNYKYDILVLATGSVAGLPPYMTAERAKTTKGVFVYRSIADLEAIIKYGERPEVTQASVIGGGLLGLEAAKAVYDMQIPSVSIMIRQDYPLNRQLDSSAGELVLKKIGKMGVEVKTRCEPSSIITHSNEEGQEVFEGFDIKGEKVKSDMVIFAIGIAPRDDLARTSGIEVEIKGGIKVGDDLQTSAKGVYAIGECASWRGNFYGLIAPGVEMADILAFNLTQTEGTAAHVPRSMNPPDLSTRLKLMGVDVASFGDYFADIRSTQPQKPKVNPVEEGEVAISQIKPSKQRELFAHGPIQCLTYHDPFSATYKKYIFTEDGQHLLGGMMIGDVGDFTKLVAITKKKKNLDVPPSDFILGSKKSGQEDDGNDLDDDTVICSCHNVTKGAIGNCIKNDITDLAIIKSKTKAGSGCGGCVPLVTNVFKAEMKKSGHKISVALCPHFKMSRQDLFQIIKIKKLRDFHTINETVGTPGTVGCEICKPAVASILSSLYNEHVMKVEHHHNQDTNDRFLANVQRNGTFSVVPRIPGGEISPDKLVAIGKIASEYGLYTKITGGQRIDLFGASKPDLPDIWAKLHAAGLESGHAYGKSLRTVKSCVGTTWCRFGVGDSVGLAIDLENRYRGVRSPHKFKGGVSGCVRECAEAQSKDFGLIATDKGWNIFVGGNGGMKPRHAQLFAQDVPPSKVVRIIDRYLMYYIRTADRLVRTAPWLESLEGGIEKLRKVILEDELGICADLDAEMDSLIGTYEDEWKKAIEDPNTRKRFRQFVNTDERKPAIDIIEERGQKRAADWPKDFPSQKFEKEHLITPEDEWKWIDLANVEDLEINDSNTTSVAVKYGNDTQLAIFHVPKKGIYATQQMCPHKRAFVLDHGIVGDDKNGNLYVSCPLHKRNFKLDDGNCLNDNSLKILTFKARINENFIQIKLPPFEDLDEIIGSSKWMVKKATAEAFGRNSATSIEIVSPSGEINNNQDNTKSNGINNGNGEANCNSSGCGSHALEW